MNKFMSALGFLTIIEIPGKYKIRKEYLADSPLYFPVVGLVIGFFMTLFYFIITFAFPVFLSIILMLILEVFLTGGAHLDGLADMFDGIYSGAVNKKKILEIMKKSDIGVYGVLSIVFLLLLKIYLLYELSKIHQLHLFLFFLVIIFMPAFGRWSMVYMMGRYANVRDAASLTTIFTESKNKRRNFYISSICITLLFLIFSTFLEFYCSNGKVYNMVFTINFKSVYLVFYIIIKNLLVIALLFLILCLTGRIFTRKIGGITGDIVGGVSEIMEVIFLLITFLFFKFL